MTVILWLLVVQGVLGALDVPINHEYRERLPYRQSAATEQLIHGVREFFYVLLFLGLAWFAWHGAWAWVLAALVLVEIALTAWDFVQEDRTRVLSAMERVMHLVLSMGAGAFIALLIPELFAWADRPTGLRFVSYGALSWLLTLLAVGTLVWGFRDLFSGIVLRRKIAT